MGDDKFERLPIFAKPEHYKIYLEPDLVNFTCNGRVDILLHLFQHTDYVKLHFDCRGFRSAKLTLDDGQGNTLVILARFLSFRVVGSEIRAG